MKTARQIRQREDSMFIIFMSFIAFTLFSIWYFSSVFWAIILTWIVLSLLAFMFIYGAGEQNKREDEAMKKFDNWVENNEIDNGIL
jgi:hypothetical protein